MVGGRDDHREIMSELWRTRLTNALAGCRLILIIPVVGCVILTAGVVLVMFAAAVIEAFVWALTYIGVGALESVDRAMYFSLVTYTTLGFGDVTLTPDWALLSAVQAANGTIMFGWSTALIFWFVQQVFRPKQMKHSNVLYPNGE